MFKNKRSSQLLHPFIKRGSWRSSYDIQTRKLEIIQCRDLLNKELANVDFLFLSEHNLILTVFDSTLNSAGTGFLFSSFSFFQRHFFLFHLVEMMMVSFLSGILNYTSSWDTKCYTFMALNSCFGLFTYLKNPFLHSSTQWMEHLGRVMLNLVIICILCQNVFLVRQNSSLLFLLSDLLLSFFVFSFTFTVLYQCGILSALLIWIRSIQYNLQSPVFEYLTTKLKFNSIGFLQPERGIFELQQWDQVLSSNQENSNYFIFLPMKPSDTFFSYLYSLLILQLAARFDYRTPNLTSNLGLNILHIVLFEGNNIQVCRWLIFRYPWLLTEEDVEGDTPISVALKELVTALFEYANSNLGKLDDGSSYDDVYFNSIYPEIQVLQQEEEEEEEFSFETSELRVQNAIEEGKESIKARKKKEVPNLDQIRLLRIPFRYII